MHWSLWAEGGLSDEAALHTQVEGACPGLGPHRADLLCHPGKAHGPCTTELQVSVLCGHSWGQPFPRAGLAPGLLSVWTQMRRQNVLDLACDDNPSSKLTTLCTAKLKPSFRWFVCSDAGELGNFGEGFYLTFYTRLGWEVRHNSLWSELLRAVLGCLRDGPRVCLCPRLRFCFYRHVATSVLPWVFSEFLCPSVSALTFPDGPRSSAGQE